MTTDQADERSPDLEIREMEIDDLPLVFHMGEKLFTSKNVPNLYRSWDEYEVVGLFHSDSEYCFVAELDGVIAGFVLGTTITKQRSAWKYGYLVWMGVDPAFQRVRVGETLFRRFRASMLEAGVRMMLVDTEADNEPALRFFERMGFGNHEAHVYMTLNLSREVKELRDRERGNGRERR